MYYSINTQDVQTSLMEANCFSSSEQYCVETILIIIMTWAAKHNNRSKFNLIIKEQTFSYSYSYSQGCFLSKNTYNLIRASRPMFFWSPYTKNLVQSIVVASYLKILIIWSEHQVLCSPGLLTLKTWSNLLSLFRDPLQNACQARITKFVIQ